MPTEGTASVKSSRRPSIDSAARPTPKSRPSGSAAGEAAGDMSFEVLSRLALKPAIRNAGRGRRSTHAGGKRLCLCRRPEFLGLAAVLSVC